MTKRILAVLLVAALSVAAFTGCAKKAVYVDGTYVGYSAQDAHGNLGEVTLTIAADKITAVTYVERMPKTKDNYPYPTAVEAVAAMQAQLIEKGDIAQVDAVAQATGTSAQVKEAVTDALKNAGTAGSYVDGAYVGYSVPDERGAIGYAVITVAGGTISDAKLYVLQLKTSDNYQYQTSLDAWQTLEEDLMTKQDPAKVDAVAQATGTSTLFKEAAADALAKAANK